MIKIKQFNNSLYITSIYVLSIVLLNYLRISYRIEANVSSAIMKLAIFVVTALFYIASVSRAEDLEEQIVGNGE